MAVNRLKPPRNLRIEFKPSPRQYELWKLLQPNYCPHCGGEIEQILIGYDQQGNPQYRPQCRHCKSQNLPQLILGGGAAGGGKSYIGSVWLVSSCIRFENIRAVVARKTLKSLKESTWNTIKSILKDWGLKEDTNYKINNLEGTLTFWNDSVIIMKEMADIPTPTSSVSALRNTPSPWWTRCRKSRNGPSKCCSPVSAGEPMRHSRPRECCSPPIRRLTGCVPASCRTKTETRSSAARVKRIYLFPCLTTRISLSVRCTRRP